MPLLKHIVYIEWSVPCHVFVYQYLTTGFMHWKGVVCTLPAPNIATACMHVGTLSSPFFVIAYTLIKYAIRNGKVYQYDIGKLQMNMGKTYTWRKSIKYKKTYNQST